MIFVSLLILAKFIFGYVGLAANIIALWVCEIAFKNVDKSI